MKRSLIVLVCIVALMSVVATAACDWSKSGVVQKCAIRVAGQERTYLLVVPRNFSGALMFGFHPSRVQAWFMSDRWTQKANAEGFAAIYPNAVPNPRGSVAWVVNRDIPFVQALLAEARENLPGLDSKRIYAVGFSNGAWFAEMAGQRIGDFAAIGAVSAMTGIDDWKEPPAAKPSVIIFHGEDEMDVPLCGIKTPEGEMASEEVILEYWRSALGCKPAPAVCKGNRQTSVMKTESTCADGKDVRLYKIEHGRHRWLPAPVPPLNQTLTDSIWTFFKEHAKP